MQEKTFKGFPLDVRGDVIGAFPSVNVIQQQTENTMKQLAEKTNQAIIDYCLKFNIDPDVLLKQKAEIELLQMKIRKMEYKEENYLQKIEHKEEVVETLQKRIKKMKCCGNCKHCKYDQNEESNEYCEKHQQIVNVAIVACDDWEVDEWRS